MPPKKPCLPPKIVNPATGRCVKADGRVGRRIAAPRVVRLRRPKGRKVIELELDLPGLRIVVRETDGSGTRRLPERAVRETDARKLERRFAATIDAYRRQNFAILDENNTRRTPSPAAEVAEPPRFYQMTKLKKPRARNYVLLSIRVGQGEGRPHVVAETVHRGRDEEVATGTQREFRVLQDAVELYLQRLDFLTSADGGGHGIFEQTGDPGDAINRVIQDRFVCRVPLPPQEYNMNRNVNLATCTNDPPESLVMMEPLADAPREKIVKLRDGYCFLGEELADYIVAAESPVNPLTKKAIPAADLALLARHRSVPEGARARLARLIERNKAERASIAAMYRDPTKRGALELVLYVTLLTGIICVADYSDTFSESQTALGLMMETIHSLIAPDERDVVMKMGSPGCRKDLRWIADNYETTCIHGIGYAITEIAVRQMLELGYTEHLDGGKLFHRVPDRSRAYLQIYYPYATQPEFISINYYTEERGEGKPFFFRISDSMLPAWAVPEIDRARNVLNRVDQPKIPKLRRKIETAIQKFSHKSRRR